MVPLLIVSSLTCPTSSLSSLFPYSAAPPLSLRLMPRRASSLLQPGIAAALHAPRLKRYRALYAAEKAAR